jgi:hypothetical protein
MELTTKNKVGLEALAIAILGGYVTANYLNQSTTSLFLGGAITGYGVAKVVDNDKPITIGVINGIVANSGLGLALGASLPGGGNFWAVAISPLLMTMTL